MQKKNKKFVSVDYSGKDFNSLKDNLASYAKRYYPTTFKDFTEASFGSLVLDSVAYTGDLLSFYMDYQYNESLLATANDYNNAIRLARQMGYKFKGSPTASGKVDVYVVVPAVTNGQGPNRNLLPILKSRLIIKCSWTSFWFSFTNPSLCTSFSDAYRIM